jgi:hypothetical protein
MSAIYGALFVEDAENLGSTERYPMTRLMAIRTESDEVFLYIVAQSAPPPNVMDLETLHAPARLASPAVSLQDFLAELTISFRVESQAGSFCADPVQTVTSTS